MNITKNEIYYKLLEEMPQFKKLDRSALNTIIADIIETIELEPALETNVIEWVNNQPLSDIEIHGMSMNMIIEALNAPFIFALDRMKKYIKRGYTNPKWLLIK